MKPEHIEGRTPVEQRLICNDVLKGQMEHEESITAG